MLELLQLLRNELFSHLSAKAPVNVAIGNIALVEIRGDKALQDSVVISLINTEINRTKRNSPGFITNQEGDHAGNMSFDVFILFSCNYAVTNYQIALATLFEIMQFFTAKNVFTLSPSPRTGDETTNESATQLQFYLEPVSLSFEEIHHMWSSLGVRQMPFILYRLRTKHA